MNLEDATLVELRQLAKEKEIKNVSKLKKEELIELLKNMEEEGKNIEENQEDKVTGPRRFYPLVNEEIMPEEPELEAGEGYQLNSEEDRIVEGIL